jgi:hypothetical protein
MKRRGGHRGHRRAIRTLVALGLCLAAGCGETQQKKPAPPVATAQFVPLCAYATRTEGSSAASRTLAIATWFTFLLPGYKLNTGEVTRPVMNCTGQPVRWTYMNQECPNLEADLAYLPPTTVKPQDLVLSSTSELERLVWATADRLSDGEAEGPVVLAEFTPYSVAVRALGTLRALPGRARLRLVEVQGRSLLIADGEYCPPAPASGGPVKCGRGTRVMLLAGQRFEPQPLRREDGTCMGPAFFPTARTKVITAKDGTKEQVTMSGKLEFAPDRLLVHEEVEVHAIEGDGAGRLLRQAQADRTVHVRGGRLYVSDASLWGRMLRGD